MTEIEEKMLEAGYTDFQVEKAQALYAFALYPYCDDEEFQYKLIGCFDIEQTDEELISKVNSEFGTNIYAEEFEEFICLIKESSDESLKANPN